jgi:hypothetical protein
VAIYFLQLIINKRNNTLQFTNHNDYSNYVTPLKVYIYLQPSGPLGEISVPEEGVLIFLVTLFIPVGHKRVHRPKDA